MTGLTFVELSATIMLNILKTIFMKQMQTETILWLVTLKLCIQITKNFVAMILPEFWISSMC